MRFIQDHENAHAVRLLCKLMKISKSSYYDRVERDAVFRPPDELESQIVTVFKDHKRRYGTRRLVAELKEAGFKVGRAKVRKVLAAHDLQAIQPKCFVPKTTRSHPNLRRSPNLLLDYGPIQSPDEVYVGDITYLPVEGGKFAFLATFQDGFTRKLVGWELADHMRETLVLEALNKAIITRRHPKGLIIHTDGGGQYSSKAFRKKLSDLGFKQSMTRRDNHYDNAQAESFYSRFKAELLEGGIFQNVEDARLETFDYIEGYYNTKRRHSSLGYICFFSNPILL
ncbi:MAG: IS3 family transposase [Bacteroidota bacterium]